MNILYCGDNLEILQRKIKKESVDLIYINPPFFNNKQYAVIRGEESEMVVHDLENEDKTEQGCYIDEIFEKENAVCFFPDTIEEA